MDLMQGAYKALRKTAEVALVCATLIVMMYYVLLGERVMARDFDRQVAELQIRAVQLNRFTQLGTPQAVLLA